MGAFKRKYLRMKKFECDGCVNKKCIVYTKGPEMPKYCTAVENMVASWKEVKEAVTDWNQLPKLTVEVFDRPECPKNVQYVVVTSEGRVVGYTSKPYINTFYNMHKELTQCWAVDTGCSFTISAAGTFDASDWQNSLIERSAKVLPAWVKVGK